MYLSKYYFFKNKKEFKELNQCGKKCVIQSKGFFIFFGGKYLFVFITIFWLPA